jgi:uncharacterized protein (AIM24 family)
MSAGDEVRAEAGAMTFMTEGIEMDARLQGGILGGPNREDVKRDFGGALGALGDLIGGDS